MSFVSQYRVPRPLIAPARTEAELVASLRAHRRADPLDFLILQADQPLPDFDDVIYLMNEMAHFAREWVAVCDGAPPVGEQVDGWLSRCPKSAHLAVSPRTKMPARTLTLLR